MTPTAQDKIHALRGRRPLATHLRSVCKGRLRLSTGSTVAGRMSASGEVWWTFRKGHGKTRRVKRLRLSAEAMHAVAYGYAKMLQIRQGHGGPKR